MITMKMEIPESAWQEDPFGIALANRVNSHLPDSIRVFSILPVQKGFDPRRECELQKYSYLLPAEVIGIQSHYSAAETNHHISDFNSILNEFEGDHAFHNYIVRSKYRTQLPTKRSSRNGHMSDRTRSSVETSPSDCEESDEEEEDSVPNVTSISEQEDLNQNPAESGTCNPSGDLVKV